MSLRIGLLTTSYPRRPEDEAGVFVKRLVEGFDECGAGGFVIVPRDAGEPAGERQGAFEIRRYSYGVFSPGRLAFGAGIVPNLRRRPQLLAQAPMLLLRMAGEVIRRRRQIDLVHANWLVSGIAGCLAAALCRKPLVVTVRGEDLRLLGKRLPRTLLRPVLKRSAALVCVSEEFSERLKRDRVCDPARVHFIPNGVSVPMIERRAAREELGLSQAGRYLLFVGTVIPRKAIDVLIRALAEPQLGGFELIVCGRLDDPDYREAIEREAARLGCSSRLRLLGAVPPDLVPAYLATADYYVSASTFEGRPNSVLEAMAAGKAVVLSDIPSHREISREGTAAALFEAGNPGALARGIDRLERNPAERQALESAAREGLANNSWQACARKYLELFEKAIL